MVQLDCEVDSKSKVGEIKYRSYNINLIPQSKRHYWSQKKP